MRLLILNVFYNPREIPGTKTYYAVAFLPIQQMAIYQFMIYVVRARALKPPVGKPVKTGYVNQSQSYPALKGPG